MSYIFVECVDHGSTSLKNCGKVASIFSNFALSCSWLQLILANRVGKEAGGS